MVTFQYELSLGLGNVFFMMANAYAVAKRNNTEVVWPDMRSGRRWGGAEYEGISLNELLAGDFTPRTAIIENIYDEKSFAYSPIEYKPNLLLRGYFQSEKYFEDCKDDIKNLLRPKTSPIWHRSDSPLCSIHVRRGDYQKMKEVYYIPTMEYYKKAMWEMGNCRFVVFSDDIGWCINNFPKNCVFMEGGRSFEDLFLIAQTDCHINANSTFSWWGAWLGGGKTITPAQWFVDGQDDSDIYPQNWIRI